MLSPVAPAGLPISGPIQRIREGNLIISFVKML